ncbi:MAG: winged helix-turn-helix domain-containing protein, partial [Bryobacteraceae bacterium]
MGGNRVCFGVFELDREARELWKRGVRIKLEDQPFEILTALLERPGEVVSRSALEARVWPEGIFVDFDKGLTKAINKVRTALGDTAATPRYVETLSRRGYRFIAPLVVADTPHASEETGTAPLNPPVQSPPVTGNAGVPKLWLPEWGWATLIAAALTGLLAAAVGLNIGRLRDRLGAPPPRIDSLAVLPLKNLSGDPARDYVTDGLAGELIADLSRIRSLRVISQTSSMRYKGTQKDLPQIAGELKVNGIVEGSVRSSGNRMRIIVTLIHVPPERQVWAGDYERDMGEIERLPQQLALAIAD